MEPSPTRFPRRGANALRAAHILVCIAVLLLPLLLVARSRPELSFPMFPLGSPPVCIVAGLHLLIVTLYGTLGWFHIRGNGVFGTFLVWSSFLPLAAGMAGTLLELDKVHAALASVAPLERLVVLARGTAESSMCLIFGSLCSASLALVLVGLVGLEHLSLAWRNAPPVSRVGIGRMALALTAAAATASGTVLATSTMAGPGRLRHAAWRNAETLDVAVWVVIALGCVLGVGALGGLRWLAAGGGGNEGALKWRRAALMPVGLLLAVVLFHYAAVALDRAGALGIAGEVDAVLHGALLSRAADNLHWRPVYGGIHAALAFLAVGMPFLLAGGAPRARWAGMGVPSVMALVSVLLMLGGMTLTERAIRRPLVGLRAIVERFKRTDLEPPVVISINERLPSVNGDPALLVNRSGQLIRETGWPAGPGTAPSLLAVDRHLSVGKLLAQLKAELPPTAGSRAFGLVVTEIDLGAVNPRLLPEEFVAFVLPKPRYLALKIATQGPFTWPAGPAADGPHKSPGILVILAGASITIAGGNPALGEGNQPGRLLTVPPRNGESDLVSLRARLEQVKNAHPEETRCFLQAAPDVSFDTLAQALDTMQGSLREPLFPDVILVAHAEIEPPEAVFPFERSP